MAKLVSARLFRHYALGLPASDSLAEFLSVTLHIAGSVFLIASALPGLTSLSHLAGRGANLSLVAAVCLLASTGWDVLATLAAHTLSYSQLPAADRGGWDAGGRGGGEGDPDSPGGTGGREAPLVPSTGRTHHRVAEYSGVGGVPSSTAGGPLSASSHPPRPTRGQALCDGVVALGTFASAVARLNAALLLWLAGDGASAASAAGRRHGVWAAGLGAVSMLVGLPLAVSPWEAGWGGAPPPPGGWARAHRSAVGVAAALAAASVAELTALLLLGGAVETATAVAAAAAAASPRAADAPPVTVDPMLLGADGTPSWILLGAYALLLVGAVANQVRVGDLPTVDTWWAASVAAAADGGGGGGGRPRDVEAWGGAGGDAKAARAAASDAGGRGGGGRGGGGTQTSSEALWASGRGGGGGGRGGHDLPGRRVRSGRERDGGGGRDGVLEPPDVDAYVGGGGGGGDEKLLRSKKYRRERRR